MGENSGKFIRYYQSQPFRRQLGDPREFL